MNGRRELPQSRREAVRSLLRYSALGGISLFGGSVGHRRWELGQRPLSAVVAVPRLCGNCPL